MLCLRILTASHRNESLPRDSVAAWQCDGGMAGSSTAILITAESFPRVTHLFPRNRGLYSQWRLIVRSAQPSSCPDVLREKYPGTEHLWDLFRNATSSLATEWFLNLIKSTGWPWLGLVGRSSTFIAGKYYNKIYVSVCLGCCTCKLLYCSADILCQSD